MAKEITVSSWRNYSVDQNSLEDLFKKHLQTDQHRLNRIEEKIDKLAEFVVQIARVEEKLEMLEASRDKMGERLGSLETKQLMTENVLGNHEKILGSLNRLFWAVITTAASGVVGAAFFIGG